MTPSPRSSSTPMCEMSNTPQCWRTAWCSCTRPPNCTAISQPAKGTMRPPAAFAAAFRGVRDRDSAAGKGAAMGGTGQAVAGSYGGGGQRLCFTSPEKA